MNLAFWFFLVHAQAQYIDLLKAKGFTCLSRPQGDICTLAKIKSPDFTYSQPFAVLVPSQLLRPERTLLYLHGFRGVCESASATPEEFVDAFQLLEQMPVAGADKAIMLLPMSKGKCTTYDRELVPRFSSFLKWAEATLAAPADWIVTGHSGAGKRMARILADFSPKVDSVILLDATYDIPSLLPLWKKAAGINHGLDIFTVYVKGSSTQSGSELLETELKNNFVQSTPARTRKHCEVPRSDFANLLNQALNRPP